MSLADDNVADPNETINLTLTNAIGATLGSPAAATVTIVDGDSGGSLQYSASSYTVNEASGSVTITVTRTGGSAGAVAVNYATANGTAQAPGDYTAKSGTLNWADGDSANKTFTVTVANDASAEGPETVQLSLTGATGGATLGTNASATLVIDDTPGAIVFTQTDVAVLENAGTAHIAVSRVGGSNGAVSVNFKTADTDASASPSSPGDIASSRTATPGSDYTATAGTLLFANGENSKDIAIPILLAQNDPAEPSETLEVALCEASGTNVGPQARAVLTIADFQASASPGIVLSPTALNRPGQLPINVHPEITLSTLVDQSSLTANTAKVRCDGFDSNGDPDTQEFLSAVAIFDPDETTVTVIPSIPLPATGLPPGYACSVVLTNGVKDPNGTPITGSELVSTTFTIGDDTDTSPPTVNNVSPPNDPNGNTPVAANTAVIAADVNDYMINSLSLNSKNIQLSFKEGNEDRLVAATVSFPRPDFDAPTTGSETITYRVTLKPACGLRPNTQYTVHFKGEHAGVTKGVRDITGRPLAADVTWSFKTAP